MHKEGTSSDGNGAINGSGTGLKAGGDILRVGEKSSSLGTLSELADMLAASTEAAIKQIEHINSDTQVLAMNALIEASRAGEAGKAFSVVAEEMERLSRKVIQTTDSLRKESRGATAEMRDLIKMQATNIRGVRLSDLALTNIDLVDRSLYERSCDVRWWAKDASIIAALAAKTADAVRTAEARMGLILDSYTVYFDLVLCDTEGKIIANGRPGVFKSQGTNHRDSEWFKSAMKCAAGNNNSSFGFQSVHRSPLANGQHAIIFSCPVMDNGSSNETLGVLGTVFNWEGLAQEIVNKTPLSAEDKAASRVCITDDAGTVLADTERQILQDAIRFAGDKEVFAMKKGFAMKTYKDEDCCIAHAISNGYETYASGWHSIIIQKLGKAAITTAAVAATN